MASRQARVATTDPSDLPHEMWPLDFEILKRLPNDDQMLGGVHYVGRQVKDVASEINEAAQAAGAEGTVVTSAQVQTRMRICKLNRLVVDRPATGGRVWQRTQKAITVLERNGHLPPSDVPPVRQSGELTGGPHFGGSAS